MNRKKTSGKKKIRNLGIYLARLSSFLEILENVVPFATSYIEVAENSKRTFG